MTATIVCTCVLLVLLVVLLLRVGVEVEYGQDALVVRVRIGPAFLQVFPVKKKDKQEKTKKERERKAKPPKDGEKKGGKLSLIMDFLPLVLRTVKRLCGKLQVDKLDLVLTAGGEDPGDAALLYGRANAVLGSLWHPIVNTCHVVDGHARVDIDFQASNPTVYLLAGLSLRIGQILALALAFAVRALGILIRRSAN